MDERNDRPKAAGKHPRNAAGPAGGVLHRPPDDPSTHRALLVEGAGTARERRYPFGERLEIGRFRPGRPAAPGSLLIADPTVSSRHCVITCGPGGEFRLRDVSRNGTRLDGRRLVPNLEVELRDGQSISVGAGRTFRFAVQAADRPSTAESFGATVGAPESSQVTILVGDIRDYTGLIQRVPAESLEPAVRRVFSRLEAAIRELGGTVKEYQGDAVFAFWEPASQAGGNEAAAACRAALELDRRVREMARDRDVWSLQRERLQMDWAVTSGPVVIDSVGGERPAGLLMLGRPVVLAFRLEKLAGERTARVLACSTTARAASFEFEFRPLGPMRVAGFDRPEEVFALLRPRASGPLTPR